VDVLIKHLNEYEDSLNNLKAWCGDGQYKHVVDREAGYSLW